MFVIFTGLPGTGKSTLCRELRERLGGMVLSLDSVRAALFDAEHTEYSVAQNDFVQHLMVEAAHYLIKQRPGERIYFDGRSFSRAYQIRDIVMSAQRFHTPWRIIHCTCRDETAKVRLERDVLLGIHPAKNRDFGLYRELKETYEPVALPHLLVDTDRPLEECAQEIAAYIAGF